MNLQSDHRGRCPLLSSRAGAGRLLCGLSMWQTFTSVSDGKYLRTSRWRIQTFIWIKRFLPHQVSSVLRVAPPSGQTGNKHLLINVPPSKGSLKQLRFLWNSVFSWLSLCDYVMVNMSDSSAFDPPVNTTAHPRHPHLATDSRDRDRHRETQAEDCWIWFWGSEVLDHGGANI